ncbi:uridine diphosphate-N-acetylglucosamine-binding protein YvcK, partial [Candidatus Pacearchaeota archaeon]|nr:uridine diphosphate-N-acetylglucosamine-binding protein YvcK [Candidatus Pacearchaeota archaeon]MBD3283796.1 uridine diphosphate-N-acetylglucosamine-binding protein YvcK [Candidatus Pacearchaeota archaeon]
LNIRKYFDNIFIDEKGNKDNFFINILALLSLEPEEVAVIGDRIDNEIETANKLGMKSIRLLKGKYSKMQPENINQEPEHTIKEIQEILDILKERKTPKIVTIGGGTGTSPILEGLKKHIDDITTVVTVTDTGRSTGKLRKELNILAPGDTRNCLIALANSEEFMCDLFQYRFENGTLEGYSFGNLLIAALTKLTGSFEKAIEEASRILKLKGKVLPSTFDNINICAELDDGNILEEEDKIIDRHNEYVHLRPRIKKVFHKPEAKANKKAIEKIKNADLIVLCPGSLYTSIISNLLVLGIPEAINNSPAKKVYICNIMTQQSQTPYYKASDHVKELMKYLKSKPDFVIINTKQPNEKLIEAYKKENAGLVENDSEEIEKLGIRVIAENVLDETAEKKMLWEKKDLLRHDPDKTAEVLMRLINQS